MLTRSLGSRVRATVPISAISIFLIAIAPMTLPVFSAEQLTLTRGELSASEAENVPKILATDGIGVAITFAALNDQIDGEVDVSAPKYLRAQRLGVAAVRLVPKKKSDRPILVSVPMKSGRLYQFLVQITKEEAKYSRVDIIPDQQVAVAVAAAPPAQQLSLAPEPPDLLPVPAALPPRGRGGPSVPLPPAPLTEAVDIPVPTPAPQLVAVAAKPAVDGRNLADTIAAGLPVALKSGKIKPHSDKFNKVQKAIALLRFGQTQSLKQVAKQVRLKKSVLEQLHQWGQS